jgi:protein-tyrosine kinase
MKLEAVAAEQDFKLIQRLFVAPGRTRSAVAFCPIDQGSGCSWIVSRIARSIVRNLSQSVCVVDADFRSPSQHRNFALSSAKGFAQCIVESIPARSLCQQVSGTNLWVLPAGGVFADPYRLLMSERVTARIEELRKEFDYVLIDTPAAGPHADATLVGKWTDGLVLVVGADHTNHETAAGVRENVDALGIPILGAVLNERTYPIPEFLYRRL